MHTSVRFSSYYFEDDFLIWWGERKEDKRTQMDLGFLPFGGSLETRIANAYDSSSFHWEELFLLVLRK